MPVLWQTLSSTRADVLSARNLYSLWFKTEKNHGRDKIMSCSDGGKKYQQEGDKY